MSVKRPKLVKTVTVKEILDYHRKGGKVTKSKGPQRYKAKSKKRAV